ncbi:hypothetical protein [Gorillibacterium timonense]|uniref:hypothetical protein n=1 Tax=Gorillibacterium timonense TaxID=1689269 RepID=UPI00071D7DD7|nr:hypothetical protein [Gorillibacterium timonense]
MREGKEEFRERFRKKVDRAFGRLLDYQVELPPTLAEAKRFAEEYADFSRNHERIIFTIENLNGDNVGGINLSGIYHNELLFGLTKEEFEHSVYGE